MLFQAVRPILLNGIEDVISRPDLADRTIFLTLAPGLVCGPEGRLQKSADAAINREAERPQIEMSMRYYIALLHKDPKSDYGVSFSDLSPSCHRSKRSWPIPKNAARHTGNAGANLV
jgi:hypothetical protein